MLAKDYNFVVDKMELDSKAAQIFINAAEYIRNYGWQVSGMSQHRKPRCSMGALKSAYPKLKWEKDLASIMYSTLYKELNGISLTQFNYNHNDGEKVAQLYEKVACSLSITSKTAL
jgi:hypothetical protein